MSLRFCNIERPPQPLVEQFAGAQTSFDVDTMQGRSCLHYAINSNPADFEQRGIAYRD